MVRTMHGLPSRVQGIEISRMDLYKNDDIKEYVERSIKEWCGTQVSRDVIHAPNARLSLSLSLSLFTLSASLPPSSLRCLCLITSIW
jgi:hypothetical protein